MFVARLVIFTWAPGIAAAVASVIVPTRLPSVAWPNTQAANRQIAIAPETRNLIFMDPPGLSPRQRAGFELHDPGRKYIELTARQVFGREHYLPPLSIVYSGRKSRKLRSLATTNEIVNDASL